MILRKFCALAVAVAPAMWAIPAVAQGRGPGAGCGPGGWGRQGAYWRLFDPKTIETVSGEIVSVQRVSPTKGVSVEIRGKPAIIASELSKGGESLKLRDADGNPLGGKGVVPSEAKLVTDIIAPSHAISGDPSRTMAGGVSRMGDFGDALTVRQLVDLVASLQALYGPSKLKR